MKIDVLKKKNKIILEPSLFARKSLIATHINKLTNLAKNGNVTRSRITLVPIRNAKGLKNIFYFPSSREPDHKKNGSC